jgi:hypothetical protein
MIFAAFKGAAYLLTLALFVRSLWWLAIFLRKRWRELLSAVCEHWKRALIVSWIFSVLVFCSPFLLNGVGDITAADWKFWLQTVAGNWSPDSFPPISSGNPPTVTPQPGPTLNPSEQYLFALSAVIAFWLNNAIILAVIGFFWRLALERRTAMKLRTAFALRDAEIETTVFEALTREMPKGPDQVKDVVQEAVRSAAKHWETKTLDDMYGPEEAERLRRKMKDLNIAP